MSHSKMVKDQISTSGPEPVLLFYSDFRPFLIHQLASGKKNAIIFMPTPWYQYS